MSIGSPSFNPSRLAKLPATTLRTTTSTGTIVTFFVSSSRSLSRSTKCVGTPACSSNRKSRSDTLLLMTPFSAMVPRFCALNAVASSLKYWTTRSGCSVAKIFFALPSYSISLLTIPQPFRWLPRKHLEHFVERPDGSYQRGMSKPPIVFVLLHLFERDD